MALQFLASKEAWADDVDLMVAVSVLFITRCDDYKLYDFHGTSSGSVAAISLYSP